MNSGASGASGVTVFCANGAGGHNVGLCVGGLSVSIVSGGAEDDAACVALADEIRNAGDRLEIRAAQERRHTEEVADLRAKIRTLAAHVDSARATIDTATRGARRFNGPVLCKPHSADQWDGAVWLLDPAKQEDGFGLYFGSLHEVRAAHPELWVVGIKGDGILLDARPLASAVRS